MRYPKRHRFGCVQVEGIHEQFYMPILLGLVTRHLKHKVAQLVSHKFPYIPISIFSNSASKSTDDQGPGARRQRVQPVKNLLQDCHGRKPPIRKKHGKNLCQMFFDAEAKVALKHCTHHIPGTERNCLSSLPAQNLHRPHISFARTDPEKKTIVN